MSACLLAEGAFGEAHTPEDFTQVRRLFRAYADWLWLARIEGKPAPKVRLNDQPCGSLAELRDARAAEDARMIELVDGYAEGDLEETVRYRMVTRPGEQETPLHLCWVHLFNHQTHHRGQVHDQLMQTEVAPPPLDLIYYLRRAEEPR
jgi:uncharacterized damage-inducible protein DinB